MNKTEMIEKIMSEVGLTKGQAAAALASVLGGVAETLKNGEKVTLVGFGTFSVTKRSARMGRNPQTGAEIQIPAKNIVKFKAGKELAGVV